jgi:DNA-binding NarL/FixJ family response regulator
MRRAPPGWQADLVRLRCLLVDDNAAFLETARILLDRQGVTVAGTASSTAEALRLAAALRPDAALVDIGLGCEDGFDLARRLSEERAGLAVIMISTAAEADYADLVAASPAAGFLPKATLSAAGIRRILAASGRRGR